MAYDPTDPTYSAPTEDPEMQRLKALLARQAGAGDVEAGFNQQRALAAKLREQHTNRAPTGTALGTIFAGIGDYRAQAKATEMDQAAKAGLDAVQSDRRSLVQALQDRGLPDDATGRRNLQFSLAGTMANPVAAMDKVASEAAVGAEKTSDLHQKMIYHLMETGMKLAQAKALADRTFFAPKFSTNSGDAAYSGQVTTQQPDGTLKVVPMGAAKVPAAGAKGTPETPEEKRWIEFGNKFNSHIASARNPMGVNQNLIDRASRVKALANPEDVPNLDRREMEELAMGVAAMVQGGNVQAESTIKALVPSTLQGNLNKVQEWLLNAPQGLDQQMFAKRLLKAVNREEAQGFKNVKAGVTQGARTYIKTLQHPSISPRARAWFVEQGWSPEETDAILKWTGVEAPAKALPGATAPAAKRVKVDADGNVVP